MSQQVILQSQDLRVDLQDERAWLHGEPLRLGAKPFALLCSLMQSPQRLLTKDDLIETVWEGRAVSEAVLTTAMRELRRTLGDDARNPQFIETAHGRGYRFIQPVEKSLAQGSDALSREIQVMNERRYPAPRFVLGAVAVLAAVLALILLRFPADDSRWETIDPSSIAVLPFEDLSETGDQAYFARGLSEEILNVLTQVDGLSVASRTSSFSYSDIAGTTAPQVGRELGVRHVLEGSIRRTGDRVRVTAQLIDAKSDVHRWSQTFEQTLTVENLFDIQDDIASKIVLELEQQFETVLGAPDAEAASAASGTMSLEAYDAYLRARELFNSRSDVDRALVYARSAVATDPGFAKGWELLAATAFIQQGMPTPEAQGAAATALELDPNLSLAHAIRGVMGNIDPPYDWSAAIADLERALELDPKNTTALLWLGVEMRKLGYLDRAQSLFERCLALDPAYLRCRNHLLWTLHMNGASDRAIAQYRTLVDMGAPPDDTVLLLEALKRRDATFADEIVRSLSSDVPIPDTVVSALKNGDFSNAAANKALVAWLGEASFNRRDVYTIILAFGRYDLILAEQGSFFGLWLPEFPEFRESDAFHQFVSTLRIDAFWREVGFPPQCRAVGAVDFECI